jgi:hypothetical protein
MKTVHTEAKGDAKTRLEINLAVFGYRSPPLISNTLTLAFAACPGSRITYRTLTSSSTLCARHIYCTSQLVMPAKYQLTAKQLELQEERRRKKAEKPPSVTLISDVVTTAGVPSNGNILKREWLRKRPAMSEHSSVRIMTWNVSFFLSLGFRFSLTSLALDSCAVSRSCVQ